MPQAVGISPRNGPASQLSGLNDGYYLQNSQMDRINTENLTSSSQMLRPSMMAMHPTANTSSMYNPQASAYRKSCMNYNDYHPLISEASRTDMDATHVTPAAAMPQPNYGEAQYLTRNGSMASSNSQMTYSSPMTPVISHRSDVDSTQRSPFNTDVHDMPPTILGQSNAVESVMPNLMSNNHWGSDGQSDNWNNAFTTNFGDEITNTDSFLLEMFPDA